MQVFQLEVKGMHCSNCQAAVTGALKKLSGVGRVDVNLDAGTATVEGDPALVDYQKMIDAVDETGFEASVKTVH